MLWKGRLRPPEERCPHFFKSCGEQGLWDRLAALSALFPPVSRRPQLKAWPETGDGRERSWWGRGPAASEAESRQGQGLERTGLPGTVRLAELPAARADRKSRPRGRGRGLIRILFAMQQLGGELFLADLVL